MFSVILVPIDLAQESSWRFALPEALDIAGREGSRVVVMTVVREMQAMFENVCLAYELDTMLARAEGQLRSIISPLRGRGITIDHEVRFGSIAREIVRCATTRQADLIVMASHRPEIGDFLIGPIAAHVAEHAPCSVLVVRSGASASSS